MLSAHQYLSDLQHNLFLLTFDNQMFLSPAGKDKPVKRALDAGTGTGIWAMEYGMCCYVLK